MQQKCKDFHPKQNTSFCLFAKSAVLFPLLVHVRSNTLYRCPTSDSLFLPKNRRLLSPCNREDATAQEEIALSSKSNHPPRFLPLLSSAIVKQYRAPFSKLWQQRHNSRPMLTTPALTCNGSQSGIITGSEYHTRSTELWEESLKNLLFK